MAYFKYLHEEKKAASSSMWTYYSYINSICQRKYSVRLQQFPRITQLLKSYDTDVKEKAEIFDETLIKGFMVEKVHDTYWLVRQVIAIMGFFGGLRFQECALLELERIKKDPMGYYVYMSRKKQRRSDK